MGEVAWLGEPTRGQMARPPWAMVQRGGIVVKGNLGCYSVASTT